MAQGFGAHTTADEVLEGIDLAGRRVLVTGVPSDLGLETADARRPWRAGGGRRPGPG